MYSLSLKIVISFLKFEIFCEDLFDFMLQKLILTQVWQFCKKGLAEIIQKDSKVDSVVSSQKIQVQMIFQAQKVTLGLIFCTFF